MKNITKFIKNKLFLTGLALFFAIFFGNHVTALADNEAISNSIANTSSIASSTSNVSSDSTQSTTSSVSENNDNSSQNNTVNPPVTRNYIAIYRLYNITNMEHLYTKDTNEVTTLLKMFNTGWRYEGAAWMSPDNAGVPVYRVYNPRSGEHLYTKDTNEVRVLSSRGWNKEGIAFYSDDSGIDVYRLYNPHAGVGAHFITRDENEKNVLISRGWKYEGVAWTSSDTPIVSDYIPPEVQKPYANAPVYFSQLDSRWSRVPINDSYVGISGCVPTSLAMILKGSYGMNVDAGTVAIRTDIYSHQSFGVTGKELINTANSYGHQVEQINNQERAADLLKAGYPLIFYVNVGVGHAVVVYGYNNGIVSVLDPYGRKFYPTGSASLSSLWNKPSSEPVDWDAGRPVFAIK
ncbi:MAG: C39 family peptidase [Lactobacillaceae bacterium]|nr:C39 family peptidase [Lactobacillaceae bacterium]